VIAFSVKLNGKSLGTAGTSDASVLSAIISAVGKLGSDSRGAKGNDHTFYIEFTLGGLTSRAEPKTDEHLTWIREPLKIGDSVTIQVLEAAEASAPTSSTPVKTESDEARYFQWAKSFYLANRDKYDAT
jgi:hypothetical protein